MVPVRVGDQHAGQPAVVGAAGVELLADRLGSPAGSAEEPREHRNVRGNVGAEARVDEKVTLGVHHQDRHRSEVAFVAERPARTANVARVS